jgi:16S rRNA (guanine(966)-N(2))-methyltransferase RsmD
MRIIAGERKGHTIFAPRGLETRPTSDRVRENVFNIVAPWVEGARVLDLYAGSGSMGLEALSRGAASAVFVEAEPQAIRAIERNLDKLRLTGARVARLDAITGLGKEVRSRSGRSAVLDDGLRRSRSLLAARPLGGRTRRARVVRKDGARAGRSRCPIDS